MNCQVFGPTGHLHHHTGSEQSNCFYFLPLDLQPLINKLNGSGQPLVARAARIEVSDVDAPLHHHEGATIVFITSGLGTFRTMDGEKEYGIPVRQGDIVYVPPGTPHLSIAKENTRMIEMIVYLSHEGDMQQSFPV